MKYSHIPGTAIRISKLAVGGMSFGIPAVKTYRWILDEEQTDKMVRHALDLGINFFDTTNVYGAGTSEEFIGRALRKHGAPRDQVAIASKVYFNDGRLSKEAINREIDGTLKRLGTDYLDLYIIHRFTRSGRPPCTATSSRICSTSRRNTAGTGSSRWRTTTTSCTGKTNGN